MDIEHDTALILCKLYLVFIYHLKSIQRRVFSKEIKKYQEFTKMTFFMPRPPINTNFDP